MRRTRKGHSRQKGYKCQALEAEGMVQPEDRRKKRLPAWSGRAVQDELGAHRILQGLASLRKSLDSTQSNPRPSECFKKK